ncbi:uncharacterized protein KY384_002738 [Bacidia gigantensis]|uniref:uncharacterized protein n=1 Tax=Bacidia gigantensis TaxID=2732470 RepID=UPI001D0462D5|nr:uncharacterized protein KY384_002738 [Bacidia gigantensis]KAG8532860.1 hypothetical protein KY384_002738 [Bacidia gigantensis]
MDDLMTAFAGNDLGPPAKERSPSRTTTRLAAETTVSRPSTMSLEERVFGHPLVIEAKLKAESTSITSPVTQIRIRPAQDEHQVPKGSNCDVLPNLMSIDSIQNLNDNLPEFSTNTGLSSSDALTPTTSASEPTYIARFGDRNKPKVFASTIDATQMAPKSAAASNISTVALTNGGSERNAGLASELEVTTKNTQRASTQPPKSQPEMKPTIEGTSEHPKASALNSALTQTLERFHQYDTDRDNEFFSILDGMERLELQNSKLQKNNRELRLENTRLNTDNARADGKLSATDNISPTPTQGSYQERAQVAERRLWEVQQQISRNPFAFVLIDGSGYNFLPRILVGRRGGLHTAEKLKGELMEYLCQSSNEGKDWTLIVRIYVNLQQVCRSTKTAIETVRDFVYGFNEPYPGFDIIDTGGQVPRKKIIDIFTLHARNRHCKSALLGCVHDQSFAGLIASCARDPIMPSITLISAGSSTVLSPHQTRPFQVIELRSLFIYEDSSDNERASDADLEQIEPHHRLGQSTSPSFSSGRYDQNAPSSSEASVDGWREYVRASSSVENEPDAVAGEWKDDRALSILLNVDGKRVDETLPYCSPRAYENIKKSPESRRFCARFHILAAGWVIIVEKGNNVLMEPNANGTVHIA